MAGQTYINWNTILSKTFALAVGTTALQISGGTAVLAGFTLAPSRYRQGIMVYNPSSTATLYVGVDDTVSGPTDAIATIGPLQEKFFPFSGEVPLWLIGSAPDATANVIEGQ